MNVTCWSIPMDVVESLTAYRDERTPTGGFLRAVLENDLFGAVGRADGHNINFIPGITRWVYENLPGSSYGTKEKVTAWLARADQREEDVS